MTRSFARASLVALAVVGGAGIGLAAEKATSDVPDYVDEAADAGINHVYAGPWEFFVGGGVAAFDCNGDRKPDLFMAGGTNPAELFENESETGGALRFKKVALSGISDSDLRTSHRRLSDRHRQ